MVSRIILAAFLIALLPRPAVAEQKTLTWEDRSGREAGFIIERREGANAAWHVVGFTPANATEFVDTGLSVGKVYFWRVRAFNSLGMSDPSNEVSMSIQGVQLPPSVPDPPANAKEK